MRVGKVLVLRKKTMYQIQGEEYKEERFLKLLAEGNQVVNRVRLAHEEHLATVEMVHRALSERAIEYRSIARAELDHLIEDVDLMISVGGDGTFLDASHSLLDLPLLGVNSSRSSSFGHFCMANGDTFASVLDRIIEGSIEPLEILRLKLTLNGQVLNERVLNEVLVAHESPAATSRYFIDIEGEREEHRSSGILIGTPAGSTGTLRSAGAPVERIDADRFQYLVREPYLRPGDSFRFLYGSLDRSCPIKVTSQMRTGSIFIDGPHIVYAFALGDELLVDAGDSALKAFVDPGVNDMFL